MGRSPCCEKAGLKKGPWTPEEDQKLLAFIQEHGHGSWRALPAKAGLQRCGKSCRLRWTNYLRPDIKRGKFSLQEEQTIIQLHALLGNRWSAIATHLPKRTDNEIKNYWNTHLKKRLTKMGIDPVTHKPKHHNAFSSGSAYVKDAANLSHMAQWENARLEAETRLVRESKHLVNNTTNNNHSLNDVVDVTPSNQHNNGFMSRAAASAVPCLDVLKAWQGARSSKATIGYNSISGSNIGPGMNMMNMAMDELESPTSILDISALMYNDSKELPQITKEIDNSNVVLQEDHSYNAFTDGFDTNNVIVPAAFSNMMDGFDNTDDVLVYTSNEQNLAANIIFNNASAGDGGCGRSGNSFEDQNRNYWNNILNLVNASPSTGSPMF